MGSASAAWEQSTILPSVPPDAVNYTSLTSFRCGWGVDIFNTAPGNGRKVGNSMSSIPIWLKGSKFSHAVLVYADMLQKLSAPVSISQVILHVWVQVQDLSCP